MRESFGELRSEGVTIPEMSVKQADGMSIAQALAMTVAEIPVFLYSTFGQVSHFACTVKFCIHIHKHYSLPSVELFDLR